MTCFFRRREWTIPIRESARKYITEAADLENNISAPEPCADGRGVLLPVGLLLLFFGFYHEHVIGSGIPRIVNADA